MATREVGSGQTYATIAAALSAASANDTINVHAGTYTEDVSVSVAGVRIQNNTGDSPVVDGYFNVGSTAGVTIYGLKITGYGTSSTGGGGIQQSGGSGLTVDSCEIYDAYGCGVYSRNSTSLTINNVTVYGMINPSTSGQPGTGIIVISGHASAASYATGIAITNCAVHDNGADGIQVHGQYITISGCNIYDNIDTNWASTHPDGIQLNDATSDGYVDCQHVRIFNNIVKNSTQNIYAQGQTTGDSSVMDDIQIWNNVAYNDAGTVNGVDMDAIVGKAIFVNGCKSSLLIANNYAGRSAGGYSISVRGCGTGSTTIKNNIIQNLAKNGLWVNESSQVTSGSVDYNIYDCVEDQIVWGSSFYSTLAAFKSTVANQEAHGVEADPLVNALPTPTLQVGSPAIGTGVDLGSTYGLDKAGNARVAPWDIGAYAYLQNLLRPKRVGPRLKFRSYTSR